MVGAPEARRKRARRPRSALTQRPRPYGVVGGISEVGGDAQRPIPQRVDFHGLADTRRDHVIADARVHPGQLHPWLASAQQSVVIRFDAVPRAAHVPIDDVVEHGIERDRQVPVTAALDIGVDCVEIPQRGIDGVVLRRFVRIRKAIGQHALADMLRIRQEYLRSHVVPLRTQRQPGQRDHRVATPITKPRIACNQGFARRIGCRARCTAADYELIRREDQAVDRGRVLSRDSGEQRVLTAVLGRECRLRRLRARLDAERERHAFTGSERHCQLGGAHQILLRVEPAHCLGAVLEVPEPVAARRECAAISANRQRLRPGECQHIAAPAVGTHIELPALPVLMTVIVPIGDERPQRQRQRRAGTQQRKPQIGSVFAMREPHPLLDQRIGHPVLPHRNRALQLERTQLREPIWIDRAICILVARQGHGCVQIGGARVDLADQQRAPQRWRQRGDQQAVVAARVRACNRAAGKAADAVGQQPLPVRGRAEVRELGRTEAEHRQFARSRATRRQIANSQTRPRAHDCCSRCAATQHCSSVPAAPGSHRSRARRVRLSGRLITRA